MIPLLLPPSEGKAPDGSLPPRTPSSGRFPSLAGARAQVLTASGTDLSGLPCLPALERYTGVLYRALAPSTLSPEESSHLEDVLVLSGMWGVSAGTDPLPAYRLPAGRSLAGLGRMVTFWRPHLAAALAPVLAGRVTLSLLSTDYASMLPEVPGVPVASARFVDRTGRALHSVALKQLRGRLARAALSTDALADLLEVPLPGVTPDRGQCRLGGPSPLLVWVASPS